MTFAEILILGLVIALVFYILNPLRRRLETRLYKAFRSQSNSPKKHNDIQLKPSDYTKKDNLPHE
jgi:hypothetical protein